jgi:hypothetical protein
VATVRTWQRTLGQFLANGATPLVANQNQISDAVTGGASLLRARTDIEFYVTASGTSGNIDFSVYDETVIMLGLVFYDTATLPTTSGTPITDASGPLLGATWLQWEYMYFDLTELNNLSPQFAVGTYRPRGGTIDTQSRRTSTRGNAPSLWMPWEVQNGSGLINTTTGGVTYALGVRFAQSALYELRT